MNALPGPHIAFFPTGPDRQPHARRRGPPRGARVLQRALVRGVHMTVRRPALGPIRSAAILGLAACGSSPPTPPAAPEPMTLDQRVDAVRAHMDGRTGAHDEAALLTLFTEVHGAELRALKRRLDADMTSDNLVHLVTSDLDDDGVRARLVSHLATADDDLAERQLRVLSDIDDTVYCSLHDPRYPKGTAYPGVHALYTALGQRAGFDPATDGVVTFLSARPGDRAGLVESATLDQLRGQGFERATLLVGTALGLRSHDAMADGKIENFELYRSLYPEYRFVFVGDSGQGDVAFGRHILANYPDDVAAVLIHDVVASVEGPGTEPRLRFFDTYAGAAKQARDLGLLSPEAAGPVEAATRDGLAGLPLDEAARQALLTALAAETP